MWRKMVDSEIGFVILVINGQLYYAMLKIRKYAYVWNILMT
jgi:hypothetical protein